MKAVYKKPFARNEALYQEYKAWAKVQPSRAYLLTWCAKVYAEKGYQNECKLYLRLSRHRKMVFEMSKEEKQAPTFQPEEVVVKVAKVRVKRATALKPPEPAKVSRRALLFEKYGRRA